MTKLGLKQINNAVLLLSDKETLKELHLIQDYCAFGYPSKKTVSNLIKKRGFIKVETKRVPLSDNNEIEKALGQYGVICVDDVIDELWNRDAEKFKVIKNSIWPFQLTPNDKLVKAEIKHDATVKTVKKNQMKASKGGVIGNVEEKINDLVCQLI